MIKRVSVTFDKSLRNGLEIGNARSHQELINSRGYLAVTQFIQHLLFQANAGTGYRLDNPPAFVKPLKELFGGWPKGDGQREPLERTDRITVFVQFSPRHAPPAYDCFVVEAEFYERPEPLSHATMVVWFRRDGTVERQQLHIDTRFMNPEPTW